MKRVSNKPFELEVTFEFKGKSVTIPARRLLDLKLKDSETLLMRVAAREIGIYDGENIISEDGVIIAKRIDFFRGTRNYYFFAFLVDWGEGGESLVEPSMDNVPDADWDEVYKARWEYVNNPQMVEISWGIQGIAVSSEVLIFPNHFNGSFSNNTELRELAIEQGEFHPFPL